MITITDNKTHGTREVFTLNISGVSISGCQYKAGTSAKGEYEFIAMPQHKITTKDGDKWVGNVRLDKETADKALAVYKENAGIVSADDEPDFSADDGAPF